MQEVESVLDDGMSSVGKWTPGSADIKINRNAVRYLSQESGRTVGDELSITAYHEAFHRGIYSISKNIGELFGVNDMYSASRNALKSGIGKGYWYHAEEWAAESYGKARSYLRNQWGVK